MQKTEFIWQNEQFIPWDDAKVHVLTHTLHYGGGAFEGIRCYQTEQGPAIFRLSEHVDRLFYSANAIGMKLPYSRSEVMDIIVELVRVNQLDHGYIRPLAYYGYGGLGVSPVNSPVELTIACWPWGAYLPHDRVDVKTSHYIRIHPRSTVADAKLCGHYLNGILASLELKGTHYHEALFLDADGYVAEGAGENIFIVKNNTLYTPQLGSILAGITRSTMIELANHLHYPVVEETLRPHDIFQADEAFFTGTAAEVTPIRSLDDTIIGQDRLGPVTKIMKDHFNDIVHGRHAAFTQYLTTIPVATKEMV